ncbi:uncharacterized protein LOC100182412 [Ciona intestinalis]
MAAACLGSFGDYKYIKPQPVTSAETVWVSRPYDPLDSRDSAPVPRHKTLDSPRPVHDLPKEWLPLRERSLRETTRRSEEKHIYPSLRTTRCEDWSTLREMLPSRGRPKRIEHPKWGTGLGGSPVMTVEQDKRNPIITSAMSRFVDEMHLTHRQFKMY